MERGHGEEWVEGKCRKDNVHDLWYRPGPLAEFRGIPMRCLSYRSGQQQHLLQWLQTLGALEMQWAAKPDYRPHNEVQVGPDKLEVVASFCYLGEIAVTTRVKTAWKKFRELLQVLTSRHLSYKTRGHVYSSCVRSAMLHACETWQLTKTNL